MTPRFHPISPGARLPGDWFDAVLPENIVVGEGSVVDSSFCFKHFFSERTPALVIGERVTLWRTALSLERSAVVSVGDECYLANASIVAVESISIGHRVLVAGGATIVDSD